MKKKAISIVVILVVVIISTGGFLWARENNIQKLVDESSFATETDSVNFNTSKALKYDDFSGHLKTKIDKATFENIKTWEDAEAVFSKIAFDDKKKFDHSFEATKEFTKDNISYYAYYTVYFVNDIFGYKIDHIKVDVNQKP